MKTSRAFLTLFMLTLALFAAAGAAAQSGSQVIVEANPKTPSVGERWVLSLLVDHDAPDEVIVLTPAFSPSLFLDSFSKAPRRRGGKTQTLIEYRFIPNAAGIVFIDSFTVTTPSGSAKTEAIILEVLSSSAAQPASQSSFSQERPMLLKTTWAGAPSRMAAGENAVFTLRVLGANTALLRQLPPQLFTPIVPPGVILASLPLTLAEQESGIVLKLNLVPLNSDLRLEERTVQHENLVFEIPALFVRVAAPDTVSDAQPKTNGENYNSPADNITVSDAVQFPTFDFSTLNSSFYRKSRRSRSEGIYNTAKNFWDSGLYAQAISLLRRSERDHPQDEVFMKIRREAEESLGLFDANNERRWRRNLFFGLIFFIIFFVIVAPFACLLLVRDTLRRRAAFFFAVVFAAVCFLYFYNVVEIDSVFKGPHGRFAVTLETKARRTADIDGEELHSFKEGQPVEIILKSNSWLYVKTNDLSANTGWIPAEEAIFY